MRIGSSDSEAGKFPPDSKPTGYPLAVTSHALCVINVSENPAESNRVGGRIYHDFTSVLRVF